MKLVEIVGGVAVAGEGTFVWDWDDVNEMSTLEKLTEVAELIRVWDLSDDLLANVMSDFMEAVLRLVQTVES